MKNWKKQNCNIRGRKLEKSINRIDYLDGLRGLAAMMVVCVHSANFIEPVLLPNTVLSWLKLGRYGVQIFYIISSFTIMMSLDRLKNMRGGVLCILFKKSVPHTSCLVHSHCLNVSL